jgi:hypothetical protein
MSRRVVMMAILIVIGSPALWQAQDLSPWVGTFRGSCQNLRPGTTDQKVQFTIERQVAAIAGSDRYEWRSIYNGGAPGSGKNYQLVPVNPAKGHYQIDEGGGVRIDTYLAGDTFYSHFKVANVQMTVVERLRGNDLIMELLSFEAREQNQTAGVGSFRFQVNQRCVMRRL